MTLSGKDACENFRGRGAETIFFYARVTDISFSKCSGVGNRHGTQTAYMRHPCRDMPFSDVLSENCCLRNGTLRKANVLHKKCIKENSFCPLPLKFSQTSFPRTALSLLNCFIRFSRHVIRPVFGNLIGQILDCHS